MRNDRITSQERLEHVIETIEMIEGFIKDLPIEGFLKDITVINATLFQFAVIGEAIIHVDVEILEKYDYPWYKVRAFRNFIVHQYKAIEYRIVWESANNNLPELKSLVKLMLKNEF